MSQCKFSHRKRPTKFSKDDLPVGVIFVEGSLASL